MPSCGGVQTQAPPLQGRGPTDINLLCWEGKRHNGDFGTRPTRTMMAPHTPCVNSGEELAHLRQCEPRGASCLNERRKPVVLPCRLLPPLPPSIRHPSAIYPPPFRHLL